MISINNNSNIRHVYWQGHEIIAKYYGPHLVWQKASSCYGSGWWINDLPWIDAVAWKDGI